uniref:Uncharacterized protein n=1 Tax=Oryza glumipatula TaxID=40148 RepID=A0A0E0AWX0_9ORYZ
MTRSTCARSSGGRGVEAVEHGGVVLVRWRLLPQRRRRPVEQPDLDDIAKVALHSDALDTVKSDGMALLFESLAATGVLEPDDALLAEMRVWVCKGELGCRKKRQWQADQSYCQPILQFNVTFRAYTGSGPQQQELQKS